MPLAVFYFGKYFFKNFSTTSSHVFKLFPLKECSHFLASPAKENENKLSLTASSNTRNPYNFHCIIDFYICCKVCLRVFIRQTMKQISLNQVNQGMGICDVMSLDFRSHNACEKLRHNRAGVVLKSNPLWLIFRYNVCFTRTNFGFPQVCWKC